MAPERPVRIGIAIEPIEEGEPDVRIRVGDRRLVGIERIDAVEHFLRKTAVVVVPAPVAVATVPADEDVLCPWRVDERLDRQMRLEVPTVRLRGSSLESIRDHSEIRPWRAVHSIKVGLSRKDQLADNLLHPGRAGLRPGRNNNVVVPEVEAVPLARVDHPFDKFALLDWPGDASQ